MEISNLERNFPRLAYLPFFSRAVMQSSLKNARQKLPGFRVTAKVSRSSERKLNLPADGVTVRHNASPRALI